MYSTYHTPCGQCFTYFTSVSLNGQQKTVEAVDGGTDAPAKYWLVVRQADRHPAQVQHRAMTATRFGGLRPARAAMLVVCAVVLGACGYIVTPGRREQPRRQQTAGVWTAIATAVTQTPAGDLHVDLAIRNDTGDWSAMSVAPSGAVSLTTGDGKTEPVRDRLRGHRRHEPGPRLPDARLHRRHEGRAGRPSCSTSSAPGRRRQPDRGWPSATRTSRASSTTTRRPRPRAAGSRSTWTSSAADLTYPVAEPVDGLVQKASDPIEAINKCVLTLTSATRTDTGLEFAWHTENPTAYPTYVHIGTPPVDRLGRDHLRLLREPAPRRHADHPGRRARGLVDDGRRPQGRHRPVRPRQRRVEGAEELRQPCRRHHGQVVSDPMKPLGEFEVWFVTGSQEMYGDETLRQVAVNSGLVAGQLDASPAIPVRIVHRPVVTSSESIAATCRAANAADACVGVILWMHTFSPARMWIAGLQALQKPLLHLHTQFNRDLPWGEIDMDFMNLNQAAHGDREFGYIETRLADRPQDRGRSLAGSVRRRSHRRLVAGGLRLARGPPPQGGPIRRHDAPRRRHRGGQGRGADPARRDRQRVRRDRPDRGDRGRARTGDH